MYDINIGYSITDCIIERIDNFVNGYSITDYKLFVNFYLHSFGTKQENIRKRGLKYEQ